MPDSVRRLIEERADAIGFPALKRAASAMSDAYRSGDAAAIARLPAAERTAAYLLTRMPATYAAALRVLSEVRARLGDRPVASVLDLGAGTGSASLAARQVFPQAGLTLLERDAACLGAARLWLPDATVLHADLARAALPPHDLVIAAYAAGELAGEHWGKFWQAARLVLVAIEPGTPAGYSLLLRMRESLLAEGAHMLAPCPAESECPLRTPDWCHFAARVERSSLHRRLKEADLGYEDEKFSYIALAREAAGMAQARILRRPRQEPGRISLELCTPAGVRGVQVHKRERDQFRAARQAEWGEEWAL